MEKDLAFELGEEFGLKISELELKQITSKAIQDDNNIIKDFLKDMIIKIGKDNDINLDVLKENRLSKMSFLFGLNQGQINK